MSTTCLMAGLTLAALFDFSDWTHQGSVPAQVGGESEELEVLYHPLLFGFVVPETATTPAGMLLIPERDMYEPNLFLIPIGLYPFTSVVDDTVSPEVGFFVARLHTGLNPTTQDVRIELMPMLGSDTPAISYRGSTLLLEPGEYLLRRVIPEPNTMLLAVAGSALLLWGRKLARHSRLQ